MAERVLRMAVALFVGVYVARYLGPIQFGQLSYAISFAGLFSALAMLGLDGIVIRELVKDESRRDELLGTAFWLKIGGAATTIFLLSLILLYTNGISEENIIILIIAAGFLFQSTNVIDFYFQSKVQSKFVVHAQVAQVILSSIAKIALVLLKAPLIWFAIFMLIDSAILGIFLVTAYTKRNKLSIYQWSFHRNTAKTLLKDSWPLMLSGLAISIYMKIDQVMIRNMLGPEAVGNYAAAVRLSEAWYFIPMVITSSIFPAIINAKKISETFYYNILQQLYSVMTLIAITIAIPTTFFADTIILLLFGEQYSEAGLILAIHIWTGIFVFLGVASGKWLIIENMQNIAFYRVLAGLLVNITLNLLLIPVYNIVGAAIATIGAQITAAYLFDIFNKKTKKTFYMKSRALLLHKAI